MGTVLSRAQALKAREPESVPAEGAAILRWVQRRHPSGFSGNFELANCRPKLAAAEEMGYRRVNVALRTDNLGAVAALDPHLCETGNDAEANAIELAAEPTRARDHSLPPTVTPPSHDVDAASITI